MSRLPQPLQDAFKGIARSYASVYFSRSIPFGLLLMAVTFFDLGAGASGLVGIAVCQICAALFGFDRAPVTDGSHCYNALLVGLALGTFYEWSVLYAAVLVLAAVLCFLLTVWLAGRLAKRGLPLLTLPFLLTIWVLLLGLFNFSGVKLDTKAAFTLQHWAPGAFGWAAALVDRAGIADGLHLYLRSLSAALFQYNDLAGLVLAVALLLRSRMAAALSIYGFLLGYGFYRLFEGDFTPLIYSYIGFNFILTAIALGGFFIVPSARSHALLLVAIPVTALLLSALHTVFSRVGLPLYSLPFNGIVLLVLGALQMRHGARGLQLVLYQQYTPEGNHYKHVYYQKRFAGQHFYHLQLPVMGAWHISQGYNGAITHRDGWQHALDFDIQDRDGKTFSGAGFSLKDYHCYDLPVLAPAAGWVTTVKDGIRDNAVGDVNLDENWGNTLILKHAEGLYTKLSHLKPYSFKVKEGDYVQRGELVAACGSSGRSPEPHLHFQVQEHPFIGSQTLRYPLAYYLVQRGDTYEFHSFDVPKEGEVVRSPMPHPLVARAFGFVAGERLRWRVDDGTAQHEVLWDVAVDSTNKSYLRCCTTDAVAYFHNDGVLFYFTDFYGSRRSFLYGFYLAFQKVLLGRYNGVSLEDWLVPQAFFSPLVLAPQDLLAPFVHFLEGRYQFRFGAEADAAPDAIVLHTRSVGTAFGRPVRERRASLQLGSSGLERVTIETATRKLTARCVR